MSLQDEIAALDRIARSAPYSLEDAASRYAWVWLYGEMAQDARGERTRHARVTVGDVRTNEAGALEVSDAR